MRQLGTRSRRRIRRWNQRPVQSIAAGASRKAFVRRFSGVDDASSNEERLPGSLACLAAAARAGAAIVRVHDVAESARFLRMLRAIETPAAGAVAARSVGAAR